MTVAPIRPPLADRLRANEPRGHGNPGETPLGLAQLVAVLLHRRWLILGMAIAVTGFMTLYVNQLVPIYSSEATIVVEPSRQRVLTAESVVQGLNPDYYTNETEAAVVGSRELARKVVVRLDLIKNPLFNSSLARPTPSLVSSLLEPIKSGIRMLVTAVGDVVTGGAIQRGIRSKSQCHC